MRHAFSYLGPVLLFVAAWLVMPDPHPTLGTGLALIIAGVGAAAAALGIVLARQLVVLLGIIATVAVTFPVDLPIAWLGPPLHVLGAALALEGARARSIDSQIPPARAWGLPLLLAAIASIVPLAALLTEVGRESLDVTQGMGLGVSAPFLLLGIWLVVRALSRQQEATQDRAATWTGTVLLIAAVLLVTVPMTAEATSHQTPDRGNWEDLDVQRQFQVDANRSVNVTTTDWSLNSSNAMLVEPRIPEASLSNWTVQGATLTIPLAGGNPLSCEATTFTISRLNGSWDDETLLADIPQTHEPIEATWTATDCTAGNPLEVNVTDHLQSWADGAPLDGWEIVLASDSGEQAGNGALGTTAVYDRNPPRIQAISTVPEPRTSREDEDVEFAMVPTGEPFLVNASIDEEDLLRNASLDVLGTGQVLNRSVTGNESVNLTVTLDETTANGTLQLRVDDWDGYYDTANGPHIRPDTERPTLEPNTTELAIEVDGDAWRLPEAEALEEDEEASLTFNASDDACDVVLDCLTVEARRADGTSLETFDGNGTHELALPTGTPGPHHLVLEAEDAAGRLRTISFFYNVSEPRAPTIEEISTTGFGGRTDEQEAGLPLQVNVTVEDESPPLTVRVLLGTQELNTTTVTASGEPASLLVTIDEPGNHTLVVEAEDRWENNVTASHDVEIKPDLAPLIDLPEKGFIQPESALRARVLDTSVSTDQVTVDLFSGGSELSGASVSLSPRSDGVGIRVDLPFLLHGEPVRLVVEATDAGGKTATGQADYTADAEPPSIELSTSRGQRIGTDLWTTEDAVLLLSAEDADSGVASFRMTSPIDQALDADVATVNVSAVGSEEIRLTATDAVGNEATWTGQIRIDDAPPRVDVSIDGHDLVVTIEEAESGLRSVSVLRDETPVTIPVTNGTHRATLDGVRRGDVVNVTASVSDRVFQTTNWTGNLTVGDAPPEVTFQPRQNGTLPIRLDDADGDPVEAEVTARHRVTGNETTLALEDGNVTLPDWRGDVEVTVEATSFNTTIREDEQLTLGTGPFLHAELPETIAPGQTAEIPVTWERAYTSIDLLVERDGTQVDVLEVEEQAPGEGTVTLDLDEEGTYQLSLSGQHEDGEVETASLEEVQVDSGTSVWLIVAGVLILVLLVSLAVLEFLNRRQDEEPQEPA